MLCAIAFEILKSILASPEVMMYPHFDQPFIVDADASSYTLGVVISQYDDSKAERPVAYDSTTLNKEQRNYSPTEWECLALVWAVNKFQSFLHGCQFTLHTDHNPLVWLHKLKQPSGRLAQWIMILKEYQYKVEYQSGKLHDNADFMSQVGEEEETKSIPQKKSQRTQTDEQCLNNRAEKDICSNEVEKVPTLCVAANGPKDKLVTEEK